MTTPPKAILPAKLTEALRRIGSMLGEKARLRNELENTLHLQNELKNALYLLNKLPASAVVRAEREIVVSAELYHHRRHPNRRFFGLPTTTTHPDQLERFRRLRYLFIFHGHGPLREAALRKIVSGLPSPFLFAAIAWRLNDWALPVRRAAADCARRAFPLTDALVIAEAALVLFSREHSWRRWTDERAILIETLGRTDVACALADLIRRKQTGAAGSVLRRVLQQESLDPYLQELARAAFQPAVRVVAMQTLIDGFAKWPCGFESQWVDKSMGIARQVRVFERRPLSPMALQTQTTLRRQMILVGTADRSAAVRKVALDGLIRFRHEIADTNEIATPLALDRAPSVRERAQFLLRNGR